MRPRPRSGRSEEAAAARRPGVEAPPDMVPFWRLGPRGLALVVNGEPHEALSVRIIANGTRDLCYTEEEGQLTIRRIEDTPPEAVVHVPEYDVAIFEFARPLPPPLGKRFVHVEVGPEIEPIIQRLMRRHPTLMRGGLYEAYLGGEYRR